MLQKLLICILLAVACLGQDTARLDQVGQAYADSKQFMGSVLVAKRDAVLLSKGYGSANLEWQIPNSPDTKFRLGSVTKQFTAACILLLEERGKLKLDAPVKTYLPDAPAAWDKVTIFHLLTHTSGIPSFTSFPDYPKLEPFASGADQTLARFRDKPLEFEPGQKWKYSNSGYVLLGYLIEQLSAQSYSTFVKENIFLPLGMKDSGYDSNTAIIAKRAEGYVPGAGGPAHAGFIHMSIPHAAGGLYSTVEDLLRWERGLFGGKALKPASLVKMTTPFKSNYALGISVETVKGRKVIQHGGGIEGFNTYLAYYPDGQVTVIVLANLNGRAAEEIAKKLGAAVHGDAVELPGEKKAAQLARPAKPFASIGGARD